MEKSDLTPEQYDRLVNALFTILAEKGPSQATMDLLARRLSMSKRTLYEIFGSKDDMIKEIMKHLHGEYERRVNDITRSCDNVMEAMANVLIYHQKTMSKLSARFFRDMDTRYRHIRSDYESNSRKWCGYMENAVRLGVRQGVLRSDANYSVIVPLIRVQMESLKRMEDVFPPEITLVEAYNTIALGLLRSIATPDGMRILDKLTAKFNIGTYNEIK